jgi:hypothetical protein
VGKEKHKEKKQMKTQTKIETSVKYGDFSFLVGNRPIDTSLSKYRKVRDSLRKNGWIESFPATVIIKHNKKFLVDGQNRFTAAKELGIPVVFVTIKQDVKISEISECTRPWSGNDYAGSHASEGNPHFKRLIAFCDKHNISACRAANLLSAKTKMMGDSSGFASAAVKDGSFKFTNDGLIYAEEVLRVCSHLPSKMRKNRAANAAIARILLIEEVNPDVLVQKLDANQSSVTLKATVEECIQMLESIYNKRNQHPVAIAMKVLEYSRGK